MSGDSFTIEGPVEANALTAATTATIAREPWGDSYVLVYSAIDGKLHPLAVPSGPAPSGAANLFYATPDGSSGPASLRALVADDIANGIISNAKLANSSATINTSGGITGGGSVALGGALSLSLSAVPNGALANSSITVSPGTGLAGGGAVSLGGSVSLNIDSTVATLTGSQTLTNKSIAASQLTGVVAAANGGSTTGTNGSSVQVTGTVNLGGSATWTDVTLSVALPGTGTYIINAAIRSVLVMSSGIGAISFKLVNATAGTDIADSIRVGPYGVSLTQNVATANLFALVSIVGAATIKVQASCAAFGGTYSTTNVVSDSSLATNQMHYVQIA